MDFAYLCSMLRTTTVFTPTQVHLLKMFELSKTEDELDEMKGVLYRYYSQKLNDTLDNLWDNGILSQKRLDEIGQMDLHQL